MKAKFLPFLLLTVLLQVSMFSYADEMVTARQIKLRTKTQVQHRSIPVSPDAFIENSLLTIDLLSTVPTVTVTIKDAETGEVVYTSTDLNVDKVYIDPVSYTHLDVYKRQVLYLADGEWLTANLCLRVISIRNNRLID